MENNLERLQKIIAHNSAYSRRKAEELITNGKVQVNGKVIKELGTKVSSADEIIVDGSVLYKQEKVYYLLNKPIKVVSTRNDELGRTNIVDLIPGEDKIYPIGRLDYYTSGLIILTNDGTLANGLMHPRYKIPKTYRVKFKGPYSEDKLKTLRNGVIIDGYKTNKAIVKLLTYDKKLQVGKLELTISEGKNHQVRRMLKSVGLDVINLKRTKYAIFNLDDEQIRPGESRIIKPKEVKLLYNLIK